jgi:hypothetical protein
VKSSFWTIERFHLATPEPGSAREKHMVAGCARDDRKILKLGRSHLEASSAKNKKAPTVEDCGALMMPRPVKTRVWGGTGTEDLVNYLSICGRIVWLGGDTSVNAVSPEDKKIFAAHTSGQNDGILGCDVLGVRVAPNHLLRTPALDSLRRRPCGIFILLGNTGISCLSYTSKFFCG